MELGSENYIKCLDRNSLIKFLKHKNFHQEAQILKPIELDGQKFLDFTERDLIDWKLSRTIRLLLQNCRSILLNESLNIANTSTTIKRNNIKTMLGKILNKNRPKMSISLNQNKPLSHIFHCGEPNIVDTSDADRDANYETPEPYQPGLPKPLPDYMDMEQTKKFDRNLRLFNGRGTVGKKKENLPDFHRPSKTDLSPDESESEDYIHHKNKNIKTRPPMPLPNQLGSPTIKTVSNSLDTRKPPSIVRRRVLPPVPDSNSSKINNTFPRTITSEKGAVKPFNPPRVTPQRFIPHVEQLYEMDPQIDETKAEEKIKNTRKKADPIKNTFIKQDFGFSPDEEQFYEMEPQIDELKPGKKLDEARKRFNNDNNACAKKDIGYDPDEEQLYEMEPQIDEMKPGKQLDEARKRFNTHKSACAKKDLGYDPDEEQLYEMEPHIDELKSDKNLDEARKIFDTDKSTCAKKYLGYGPDEEQLYEMEPQICERKCEEKIGNVRQKIESNKSVSVNKDLRHKKPIVSKKPSVSKKPNVLKKPNVPNKPSVSVKQNKSIVQVSQKSQKGSSEITTLKATPLKEPIWNVSNIMELPKPPPLTKQFSLNECLNDIDDSLSESSHEEETVKTDPTRSRYYKNTDRRGAKNLLQSRENGAFLFRSSTAYNLVLTVIHDKQFYKLGINCDDEGRFYCIGDKDHTFASLDKLVEYYKCHSLTVKNKDEVIELYLKDTVK